MKKIFLFIASLSMLLTVFAQQADSVLASKYKLDFVIPDLPAFKALDMDPSKVLRPSDVRELAVAFNPFFSNGRPGIPKNFALEFSPGRMSAHKWKLQDYYKCGLKRLWYNSGFSIGAVSDSAQYSSKLSVGYRFSLLSKKADPIRVDYINLSFDSLQKSGTLMIDVHLRDFWILKIANITPSEYNASKERYDPEFDAFLQHAQKIVGDVQLQNDPMWIHILDEIRQAFGPKFKFKDLSLRYILNFQNKTIADVIAQYKKEYWNASRFDLAFAWVGESKDSIFTKSRFSSLNGWLTKSLRFHKWGQVLLGGSMQLPNKAVENAGQKTPVDITGNLRLLVGNHYFRFFGEGQYRYLNFGDFNHSILANAGIEVKVSNPFWIVISTGIDNLKEKSNKKWSNRLAANLNLRYGFN